MIEWKPSVYIFSTDGLSRWERACLLDFIDRPAEYFSILRCVEATISYSMETLDWTISMLGGPPDEEDFLNKLFIK